MRRAHGPARAPGTWARTAGLAGLVGGSLALVLGGTAPASATVPGVRTAPVSSSVAGLGCLPTLARTATTGPTLGRPAPERAPDTRTVTPRLQKRWQRDLERRVAAKQGTGSAGRLQTAMSARRAGSRPAVGGVSIRIGVHAHVVDGTHARDRRGPSRKAVLRQLAVVNEAFRGDQSAYGAVSPFRFHLLSYQRTTNDLWHHGALGDRGDKAMRSRLHRGGAEDLNLYFSEPGRGGLGFGLVLGYSTFPRESVRRPLLDGVTVHVDSMPGGRARGYNLGDSAVHEIGHWLGLFHTFEGGCSARGDQVADTPAEGTPSAFCQWGKDTCPDTPGPDPVRNFLDYSLDLCMDRLSDGQVQRMARSWLAYRTP